VKLLIVLLALLFGVWLWRNGRHKSAMVQSGTMPPAAAGVQTMVCCPICGVHLPETDAVVGQRARYCCTTHRLQAGDTA